MNPRLFCRERTFHKALLLTYSFDPVFFEQIVLPDLWAGRASDILVVGDKNQVKSAIQSAVGQLWHLGKRYLLGNAEHTGSFHPKVLLRLGAKDGAVMIGSGNLTSCGWSSNRELGCAWMIGPGHPDSGGWLHPFLDEVITWCASDLERDAVRRMKDVPWLGMGSVNSSSSAPLLYSSGNRALAPALAQRWLGRQFSEVRIFTGSTDESGAFLRWAHRTFGIKRAIVALTPSLASFSVDKLMDLPLELRLIPVMATTPMHAKFYYFDGPGGPAALMGSPNCSAAAWLLPPDQSGNIETVLVYDAPQPADFQALLEIFESPSSIPEEVLTKTKPPSVEADASKCPYDLAGLRWDASSHRVMALIAPQPEPGTAVALLLGARQIAMQFSNIQGDDCWFGEVPEGIDFTSTAFASIRLGRGAQQWVTSFRWIDHLAELHHSSQTARFLESIKGLEHSVSFAEQRRILDDLQEVAQSLFSDSATFRDVGFGIATEVPQNSEVLAPPVDPVALIRNLEEVRAPLVTLGGVAPGSLSLTGILRLLFDAERVTDAEAAAEDEKLDEGQPPELAPSQDTKKKDLPDGEQENRESVNAKLQSRLAVQIETFLQNMSKAEFAQSCTATQLIQAVCFPLAVALRGQARGWVSGASAEQWGLKVFSLLFRGKTTDSGGLLRTVEQRYIDHGQASIFREIVGDGTLWMVLIATLGNSTWQGAGTFMDKALALREVFRAPQLISSAQVSRLTGLLGKLRIEDARAYLSIVAPAVSELLDRIEDQIRPVWKQEAQAQADRSFTHRAGDLLWRENVGWALCLADVTGRESVEVRLRGEKKKVGAGYYVNIPDLATRNHKLSELLLDLRVRVELPAAMIRQPQEIAAVQ
jgi:hypothetical protein